MRRAASGTAPSSLLAALSTALAYPAEGLQTAIEPLRSCLFDPACARYADALALLLETAEPFSAPGVEQPHGAEAAQLEYTRLFIGSFKMYAPPYASYYLDGEHQVQGPTTVEVSKLYARFGLELAEDEYECADHIRYLLAFAALLARTYEERGQAEFAEAYRDFVDIYILSWISELECRVDDYAEFSFYPALLHFTAEVLGESGLKDMS